MPGLPDPRAMISRDGCVLIDRTVLTTLQATAEDARFRHEVGGVLIGFQRPPHLHICGASTPQARDRASPLHFHRSPEGHQDFAEAAWRRSGGHITYLGEWHSHPQDRPVPSSIDRGSWARTRHLQGRPLVFLIVGHEDLWLSVQPSSGRAKPWTLVEEDDTACLYARHGLKSRVAKA